MKPAVVHISGRTARIGQAGEPGPRIECPACVGRSRSKIMQGIRTTFFGKEALKRSRLVDLSYPCSGNGNVDDFELLLKDLLKATDRQDTLVLAKTAGTDSMQEELLEVLFERCSFSRVLLSPEAVCSLASVNRTTGVVVDGGYTDTSVTAVFEGHVIYDSVRSVGVGGQDLTLKLRESLQARGIAEVDKPNGIITCQSIKEACCKVSQDAERELSRLSTTSRSRPQRNRYTLPDGTEIAVEHASFTSTEPLFQPLLVNKKTDGLGKAAIDCVAGCDIELEKTLLKNIVCCGGTANLIGLSQRLKREVATAFSSAPTVTSCRDHAIGNRVAPWVGASVLAECAQEQHYVTAAEYGEYGPQIVRRRMF